MAAKNLDYEIVQLRNGTCSVRSLADAETFHPGIGPIAEAEALYVRQLQLPERVANSNDEFVLWDVGLGAAANALTAIRLIHEHLSNLKTNDESSFTKSLRIISFDQTSAAAEFALQHSQELRYPGGFESLLLDLIQKHYATWNESTLKVEWTLKLGDFPTWLATNCDSTLPAPHGILFDPHSPKKNPAMWTVELFSNLFRALDPERPCALANFTRSTLARTAMLLGGFYVGRGHASGLKEETTVAANGPELLNEPLDRSWLERAKRSGSAEPLREGYYRQSPLTQETLELLQRHPQFAK
jgi:tRNA U34 5-methylaminomethyl-2-thiouridine-forming methyltransferase MnmC